VFVLILKLTYAMDRDYNFYKLTCCVGCLAGCAKCMYHNSNCIVCICCVFFDETVIDPKITLY